MKFLPYAAIAVLVICHGVSAISWRDCIELIRRGSER